MGISFSWISFDNKYKDQVLKLLELEPVKSPNDGDFTGYPEAKRYDLTAKNFEFYESKELIVLSERFPLYCGYMSEHGKYSCTSYWENSTEVWSVIHNGEEDDTSLKISGSPPECLDEIKSKALELFEVPIDLACKIGTFCYHDDAEDEHFYKSRKYD